MANSVKVTKIKPNGVLIVDIEFDGETMANVRLKGVDLSEKKSLKQAARRYAKAYLRGMKEAEQADKPVAVVKEGKSYPIGKDDEDAEVSAEEKEKAADAQEDAKVEEDQAAVDTDVAPSN